jgi:membrane protease YdiL (CAAX protease family)
LNNTCIEKIRKFLVTEVKSFPKKSSIYLLLISLVIGLGYFLLLYFGDKLFYFLAGIYLFLANIGQSPGNIPAGFVNNVIPLAKLFSFIISGLFIIVMARLLMKDELSKEGNSFVGLCNRWDIDVFLAFSLGLIIGVVYLVLIGGGNKGEMPQSVNQFVEMAFKPGLNMYCWIIIVLFISPFTEELLFRGVLFSSVCRVFGIHYSVVIISLLFILIHINWGLLNFIVLSSILVLSISSTMIRAYSRYLWPSIAIHFGYNLIIVFSTVVSVYKAH